MQHFGDKRVTETHGAIEPKSPFFGIKNREFASRPLQRPLRKTVEKFSINPALSLKSPKTIVGGSSQIH